MPASSPNRSSRSRNSKNDQGVVEVNVGDFVTVAIESIEDGYGTTRLSRDKAKRLKAWHDLEASMEQGSVVSGLVTNKVKGGLTVMINGIRAFLAGLAVDIRPVKEPRRTKQVARVQGHQLDRKRNNVVVSRRRARGEPGEERESCSRRCRGRDRQGHRQNLTGLRRVRGSLRPSTACIVHHRPRVARVKPSVGSARGRRRSHRQVLKFDQEKNRVSARLEAARRGSWVGLLRRYLRRARASSARSRNIPIMARFRRDRVRIKGSCTCRK